MKKKILPLLFLFSTAAFAQTSNVGINTTNPFATLDVNGKPTDTSHFDGIIAPRIKGDELRAKTYTNNQTGALVFVTAADPSPSGQTQNVTTTGYFYFDGTKWVAITSGVSNFSNIYTADGTLAGNRTVTQGANTLAFTSTATNGFSVDGTTFSVDAANNRIGIGLSNPLFPTQILTSNFGLAVDRYSTNTGSQSLIALRKNLSNDPTTVVPLTSGSAIGSLSFSGANSGTIGSFGPYVPPGNATRIAARAEENFSSGSAASSISLYSTPSGTVNAVERLTVASNGNIGISTNAPSSTLQVNGSFAANIRTSVTGTLLDTDYTVLATGDVTLPTPSSSNKGRIYHIVDDNNSSNITVFGDFRKNGGSVTTYGLDAGGGNNGSITVQSDGTNWVIISKF